MVVLCALPVALHSLCEVSLTGFHWLPFCGVLESKSLAAVLILRGVNQHSRVWQPSV